MTIVYNRWVKSDNDAEIKITQPKYLSLNERRFPRVARPCLTCWSNLLYSKLVDQVAIQEDTLAVTIRRKMLGKTKVLFEINFITNIKGYPGKLEYLPTPNFSIVEFKKGYCSIGFQDEILTLAESKSGLYVVFKEGESCTNAYKITELPEQNMLSIKHFEGKWLICQKEQFYDKANKVYIKPSNSLELLDPNSIWATEDFLEKLP